VSGILLAGIATAQTKKRVDDSPDQKELYNYVLTLDKLHKLANATKSLENLGKQHPELNDTSKAKTLDETVQKFQKYPEAVAVLKQNGLEPREYVVGMMTMVQAGMAVGLKKSGTYKEYPPDMLKVVSKANLDFLEQHWDEFEKLTKMNAGDKQ
jgi:hypothetical protein